VTRIWYCPNCGYEVTSRGRCHLCRGRLVASALPQLDGGGDDDEVGYRLDTWTDRDRGRLIEQLNGMEILHRFEDDELVVAAEDESRVDDIVAVSTLPADDLALAGDSAGGIGSDEPRFVDGAADDPEAISDVRLLADAARRLHEDPTDMLADADVAEASTAVFVSDHFASLDADTWAAVGRVTRRLLAALGAEDALEDQIRTEAGILSILLQPMVPRSTTASGGAARVAEQDEMDQTVYELTEWLPEQRAHLALLLEEAGIGYEWDADELVVAASSEDDVEALFGRVEGADDGEEDDEARYQAVAELFAACGRLAGDPDDEQRAAAVLTWARAAEGPPLLGMDDVDWFRIMNRLRTLVEAIEGDEDAGVIRDGASTLHDMLRSVV
jgi:hypothetical protein